MVKWLEVFKPYDKEFPNIRGGVNFELKVKPKNVNSIPDTKIDLPLLGNSKINVIAPNYNLSLLSNEKENTYPFHQLQFVTSFDKNF